MANLLCVSHEWNLGFEELRELADGGFRVIPVPSGYDAVKQFASREIDAIIVNRRLPDIEVDDLVTYFRHHDQQIPILMLSTVMPVESVPSAVDAVIQKHSCAQLLAPTLQFMLASRARKSADGDNTMAEAA